MKVRSNSVFARYCLRPTLWTLLLIPRALWWLLSRLLRVLACCLRACLRKWKPLAVMAASLPLLAAGLIRLGFYDVNMLAGTYGGASLNAHQDLFEEDEDEPSPVPPALSVPPDVWQRLVVWSMETWKQTEDDLVGDRVAAKFNEALALYRDGKYSEAAKKFARTYAACSGRDGKLRSEYRQLGSAIQLMIGNAYANQGKDDEAVAAYQISLTLDPNNLVTIYNLERLLSSGGGQGGKDGDKPKGAPARNTKI